MHNPAMPGVQKARSCHHVISCQNIRHGSQNIRHGSHGKKDRGEGALCRQEPDKRTDKVRVDGCQTRAGLGGEDLKGLDQCLDRADGGRTEWTGAGRDWSGLGRGPETQKRTCKQEIGRGLRTHPGRTGKNGLWTGKDGLSDGVRLA